MQVNRSAESANASHWKLTLSYNGSGFHGWQVQPGLVTVQGTLAAALAEIAGMPVMPQGSGRTDAGVHALAQVASFTLPVTLPPANLLRALNRILPVGLRVIAAERVPFGFHARHSAIRKHYEYRIFARRLPNSSTDRICSPFLAPFVWDCRWCLEAGSMQQAANLLVGTRDFTAMAASRGQASQRDDPASGVPNPVKTIHSASWTDGEGILLFNICGSGFLHHMVRNLVGTMVDIGRGSLAVEDLPIILHSKKRSNAGPTAPASGLYLRSVDYDLPRNAATVDDRQQRQPETAATGSGVSH